MSTFVFIIWTIALLAIGPIGWAIWFFTGGFTTLALILSGKV